MHFLIFNGQNFIFFSRTLFSFYGWNFRKCSRGQKTILTGTFWTFFSFFHGYFFSSRPKFRNSNKIFTGAFFFTLKKINTGTSCLMKKKKHYIPVKKRIKFDICGGGNAHHWEWEEKEERGYNELKLGGMRSTWGQLLTENNRKYTEIW